MRLLRRILATLVIAIVVLTLVAMGGTTLFLRRRFPTVNGTLRAEGLKAPVEVYRDRWGIPHIYAQNAEDLFFAQGYVHAQDRLWQMEFQRRIGHGALSEVVGEAALETDRFVRTMGLARAAEADLALLDDETRRILEAYTRGVNGFVETHQGTLPLEFTLLGFQPAPWRPVDSLAWSQVMAWNMEGNWEVELLRARLIQTLGEERARELLSPYPDQGSVIAPSEVKGYAGLGQPSLRRYDAIEAFLGLKGAGLGSNNWVVDGTRSATGKPLLASDLQTGIQMPSIWYGIGLHGGGFNVVGASLAGTPGVIIGHNDRIAWGVTGAGPDVQDLYIEKVNPANPNQVEFRGRWEDVGVVREEVRVKGWETPDVLEVRITRHGPLINGMVDGLEQPLACKWGATAEPNRLFSGVLALNRARNWEEFRKALRDGALPFQKVLYADVEGNIGCQTAGRIPIRANGQGLVPVPGWTGEYEWAGYVPFEEMPGVYNPPAHGIVVASDDEWEAPYRVQRITDLLTAGEDLSVEEFNAIQADVYAIPVEWFSRYILQLEPQGWLQEWAMETLEPWDVHTTADSSAASIYQVTYLKLVENTFEDELGAELFGEYLGVAAGHHTALARIIGEADNPWFDDVTTAGRESRDDILQRSFAEALDFLGRQFGDEPPKWPWGRLHTVTFDHSLSSVSPLGRIFTCGPIPVGGCGVTVNQTGFSYEAPFAAQTVASYRQIVDLGELASSVSMQTTGQSGQPFHRHYGDMIPRWQAVEVHPMLWGKEAVAASREGLLILIP